MKNSIGFLSSIYKIATMADNTIKIELSTQELPPDQMAEIFKLKKTVVAVAIAPEGQEPEFHAPTIADAPNQKTPSQRLRAVLFRYWEQNKGKYNESFDDFYPRQIEEFINTVKEKLEH